MVMAMDYEKAYKDALERARKINDGETTGALGETVSEYIFPELRESDERIRKRLIDLIYKVYANTNYITCVELENMRAWLEKQGDTTSDIRYDGVNAGASLSVINGKPFDYEHATITQKDFACDAEEASYTAEVATGDGSIKTVVSKKVSLPNPQSKEWSDEDESYINNAIAACRSLYGEYSETAHWLESLKERVQPKQDAWSEEDEEMAEDLIKGCCSAEKEYHLLHTSKEIADWLKSLKDRMKGKEEKK